MTTATASYLYDKMKSSCNVFCALVVFLIIPCVVGSLEGKWVLSKGESTYLPLWQSFEIDISFNPTAGGSDVVFKFNGGETDDIISEEVQLVFDQETKLSVKNWAFPYNIFEGFWLEVGSTKTFFSHLGDEGNMWFSVDYPLMGSQGPTACAENHTMSVSDDVLSYEITRSIRDHSTRYLFARKSSSPAQKAFVKSRGGVATRTMRVSEDESSAVPEVRAPRPDGSDVVYLFSLDDDWLISSKFGEKALLLSLQGISNRNGTKLYFVYPDDWDFTYTKDLRDFYHKQRGIEYTQLSSVSDVVLALLPLVSSSYIVYDPDVRVSIMVAFTLAGISNAIVVSPKEVSLVESAGLKQLHSFVGQFANMSDVEIYSWAYDQYWTQCNQTLTIWYGGPCGDTVMGAVADWGVQNRAFFADLSTRVTDTEEYALSHKIFSSLKPYSMVMGWHSYCKDLERTFTKLSSSCTHRVEGLHSLPNFSFSSKVTMTPGYVFKNNHNVIPGKKYVPEKKVYITTVQTDGIGLGAWTKPGRGAMPYAWELPLNYIWMAPAMLEYIYRGSTPNDYFVGALSGPGYCYPKAVPPDMLSGLLKIAQGFMKTLDVNSFETMDYSEMNYSNGTNNLPKSIVDVYYEAMTDSIGFINGYAPSYTFTTSGERPFLSFDYYLDPDRADQDAIDDFHELAAANAIRPYFLLMHVREFGDVTRTKRILDQLGPDFEIVPLDLFLKYAGAEPTYKEHFET